MDYKTPTLIFLGFLLAALSLSVLGLSADNIAYVHKHQNDDLQIHYIRWNATADAQYSYWLKMDYVPSRFTMGRQSAMLASGVICAIAGTAVVVTTWIMRKSTNTRSGLVSLISAAIAFTISLAVAVYAWYPVMKWDISFLKSLPVPATIGGSKSSSSTTYQSPFDFTPDYWNCAIAPYVANSAEAGKLASLCHEARAAKYLTIPVVILAAAMLTAAGWSWWTASRVATPAPEKEAKEMDEVSMESQN